MTSKKKLLAASVLGNALEFYGERCSKTYLGTCVFETLTTPHGNRQGIPNSQRTALQQIFAAESSVLPKG